ncbi:MAG: substrate-binding domain-containing protein [Paracoccaceae bacterium]
MALKKLGVGVMTAGLIGIAGLAGAQTGEDIVTLKSFDGFTQLRGELVGFDGSLYTIQTRLGTLEIDALLVTCEGDACPANQLFGNAFGIHGSNTIGDALMPALIEGYSDVIQASVEREIGAVENERTFRIVHSSGQEMAAIDLQAHGSGTSYPALADGRAVIGMSSRRMKDDEAVLLQDTGINELRDTGNEHIVALDGLIILVHPNNPVSSISVEEIARIFSGEIVNWSELGGIDAPINIYARDDRSGTFDTFKSLVLDANAVEISEDAFRFEDSVELSDNVSSDEAGIGFVGFAYARAAKVLPIRQECGLLTFPSTFAIKTEEYPLARRLYLYTTGRQMPVHAQRIMDFALSEESSPFIEEAGFISLAAEAQSLNQQGLRITHAITSEDEFSLPLMREMLTEFRDATRLSTTFRFTPGSSQLTAKSQRDAEQFARDIIDGAYDGKEILLVGFTDSIGQFELNRALAARRAQGVLFTMAAAVADLPDAGEFEGADIRVQGYGELTPVGCNTTFAGRVANRRVEVWIR